MEIARKKRKIAFIIGYCGTKYSGLQYSYLDDVIGIENPLIDTLVAHGHIDKRNINPLSKIKWTRSSRTDKGVHSVFTVVSCKLLVSEEEEKDILACQGYQGTRLPAFVHSINSDLPDDIRIFGAIKLQGSFNSRKFGEERRYLYLLPLWAITTDKEPYSVVDGDILLSDEAKRSYEVFKRVLKSFLGVHLMRNYAGRIKSDHDTWVGGKAWRDKGKEPEDVEDKPKRKRQAPWMIGFQSDKTLSEQRQSELDSEYDARFVREMMDIDASIELMGDDGAFIKVILHGRSFVLHQIRKIIGMSVAVSRGMIPESYHIVALNTPFKIITPLAPSEPLILDRCTFRSTVAGGSLDDYLNDSIELAIQTFKNDVVLPHVAHICRTKMENVPKWVCEGEPNPHAPAPMVELSMWDAWIVRHQIDEKIRIIDDIDVLESVCSDILRHKEQVIREKKARKEEYKEEKEEEKEE